MSVRTTYTIVLHASFFFLFNLFCLLIYELNFTTNEEKKTKNREVVVHKTFKYFLSKDILEGPSMTKSC